MWYLKPPTIPLRPQDVLNHVQPIEVMLHLPPGPSKNRPISRPAPRPPTETGGKETKATTNNIASSTVEDPTDLSWHHLRDDGDICKTAFSFTPFPLNHSVESVLLIRFGSFTW